MGNGFLIYDKKIVVVCQYKVELWNQVYALKALKPTAADNKSQPDSEFLPGLRFWMSKTSGQDS